MSSANKVVDPPKLPDWWRDPLFASWTGDLDCVAFRIALHCHELGEPPVETIDFGGVGPTKAEVLGVIRELGGQPILRTTDSRNVTFLFDRAVVDVNFSKHDDGSLHIGVGCTSWDEAVTAGMKSLKARCKTPAAGGQIEVLVRDSEGTIGARTLGIAAFPVERENYQEDVLRDYDRACAEIGSSTPVGRLLLIAGEPGTGKTYLLRGIVAGVRAGAFVILQPDALANMAGPGTLSSMVRLREEREASGPIVLLCEDADVLLVKRKMDNMSAIAALLNLCDGMIGEALDIRIVATTNAKDIEIDPAIRRPGRMIGYMKTKPLTAEHALAVFLRLVPTGPTCLQMKSMTLAEVYVLAREHGWRPPAVTATTLAPRVSHFRNRRRR